jgi:hypothetical protein
MTVYGKSEKDNLTKAERNELAKMAELIKQAFLNRL